MQTSLSTSRICFLGAGSMAEAIIRGLVDGRRVQADHIIAVNRSNKQRLEELQQHYQIQTAGNEEKESAVKQSDIIVLAMKPKDAKQALHDLQPYLRDDHMIISVIAGLSISAIQTMTGKKLPVVRTMPNTSSTIGLGATGISLSSETNEAQKQIAVEIFDSIGIVKLVDEEKLDMVTGLSGSGPAYIYYFIETMTTAAVEGGLSKDDAQELAVQTVLGAAEMVKQTKEDPATLRRKVTSPGGTTRSCIETDGTRRTCANFQTCHSSVSSTGERTW